MLKKKELIVDAIGAASNNLKEETLAALLEGSEDERIIKARAIMETVEDVERYGMFKLSKDLGVVYGPSDLSFTDFLLFGWIRERKGK